MCSFLEIAILTEANSDTDISDHTLDRLKNLRLPANRLFSQLAEMKLCAEHKYSINAIMEEYKSNFPNSFIYLSRFIYYIIYTYLLNEVTFCMVSKRQLLYSVKSTRYKWFLFKFKDILDSTVKP